jgi:hypothetical protein
VALCCEEEERLDKTEVTKGVVDQDAKARFEVDVRHGMCDYSGEVEKTVGARIRFHKAL